MVRIAGMVTVHSDFAFACKEERIFPYLVSNSYADSRSQQIKIKYLLKTVQNEINVYFDIRK